MANQTAVVGGDVKGDITSCKIENQTKSVKKDSVFSFQQTTTYITYDVCNKESIAEYKVPEFTMFGIFAPFLVGVLLVFFFLAWLDY